jgi:hypothetical protein
MAGLCMCECIYFVPRIFHLCCGDSVNHLVATRC